MTFADEEILETIRMVTVERLDIRTVTLSMSLLDTAHPDPATAAERVYTKVMRLGSGLRQAADAVQNEYGIPIVNRRVSVTPVAWIAAATDTADPVPFALALDRAALELGIDFIGGYSALVHKGATHGDSRLIASLPEALSRTQRLCGSVNAATSRAGINIDAVRDLGRQIVALARATAATGGSGCAKFVVFANAVEDNPFMAGAFHGAGEPEVALNVGVSGPGAVRAALAALGPEADLEHVAEEVKRTAFKVTRAGEFIGREVARRIGVPFGVVDLSLAPTPVVGDSVAAILEAIGVDRVGGWGTTTALALLTDAVKKGGVMASASVGGLSGAFIPVSEDAAMDAAVAEGALTLEKLEAMTAVCSVGLDMIALPGDTPADLVAGIIADALAIGVVNNKTTGARLVPVPGKRAGDVVEFGGLLGRATIMDVNRVSATRMMERGGRIPAPLQSLKN
ncbi:MAG: PFL family protein [Chloroflexi bacterium]|nr:PFL family protein [Chloroflexota bacterium]